MLPAPQREASSALPDAQAGLSVVVVAASQLREHQLRTVLERVGVQVLGGVRDGVAAHRMVTDCHPQVLVLDLGPDDGGLAAIELLMARSPLPIVLVGAAAREPTGALAGGAVDVVPLTGPEGSEAYGRVLLQHLRIASRIRVITHPRGRLRTEAPRLAAPMPARRSPMLTRHAATLTPTAVPVVAIGASTGGPPALASLLAALPADLPAAVLVVQHMAQGFLSSLAVWLSGVTELAVSVAEDGQRLRAGQVLLAPSHANLELDSGPRVRLTPPRTGQLHVPEVDATFGSVATTCGSTAVGVLLTGMGRDGASGLLAMRRSGAFTIGQDESSSAVWGMPGAALALGAVSAECPLDEIAARVVAAVQRIGGEQR